MFVLSFTPLKDTGVIFRAVTTLGTSCRTPLFQYQCHKIHSNLKKQFHEYFKQIFILKIIIL